jgi:ABC-type sugar transport system substrate-binding protein
MNRRTAALSTLAIVSACFLALLSGCGSKTDGIVLGFSQSGLQGPWRSANSESIKAAAEKNGVQLHFSDTGSTQEEQIGALREFIAQKVDVIAFTPVIETGWDAVLKEAKKAGIPVVLTEREVQVSDRLLYTTVLGSDFVEQGRQAGAWLMENVLGHSVDQNIVEIKGPQDSSLSRDRARGFREILAKDPFFRIVGSEDGDFTRAGGKRAMKALLAAQGRSITVVYSHSDEMALGAIQALEESRLRPGRDILIISTDGIRGAFEAMVAGKLNVVVESNPLIGPQLIGVVKDVVARRRLPHRLVVQEFVFPKEMAAEVLPTRKY